MQRTTRRGYTAIALYQPKHEENVGTLWRSSYLYDVALLATVGRRYVHQSSDTPKTPNKVPLIHFRDIDDLKAHLPNGCPLIGIEMTPDAVALDKFWHPPNAMYILGNEASGLPQKVIDQCHAVVQVPTAREWSLNVSVAGSLVLYDRFIQGAA